MTTIQLERESIGKGRGQECTDISYRRRDANLDTRVSFLCQLTLEELVQLGVEDAVCDEFPTLGDRGSWYRSHYGGCFRDLGLKQESCSMYWRIASGVTVVEDPRLSAKR